MAIVYIGHPACLEHRTGFKHPESAERLRVLGALSERLEGEGWLRRLDAPVAERCFIESVHDPEHVSRVLDWRGKGFQRFDSDTVVSKGSGAAALRAAGAAMAGVDAVSRGAASSAFCAIRPPGHHALPAKAMGFCIFNNVVLAVRHALTVHGVARTAVLDFDAHHGNGTEAMLRNDSRVLLCQTFQTDFFPFTGEVADEPRRVNVPLATGAGGGDFRDAVEKRWLPALRDFRPELILVSAGFDAHSADPLSGLEFSDSDYAWIGEIVANEARAFNAKVVSVLEGGYDLKALERSVDGYLRGMAGV